MVVAHGPVVDQVPVVISCGHFMWSPQGIARPLATNVSLNHYLPLFFLNTLLDEGPGEFFAWGG